MGLWISPGEKLPNDRLRGRNRMRKRIDFGGTPPPPCPCNSLLGAGFAKSVCKILIADGLEVKILTTNGLGSLL
jgi:hypothetical protein